MNERGDRRIAWAGALLAAGVSVAVNVGHAWPNWGFVAFSATLPLLLLITAEQMARRLLGTATVPALLTVGMCAYSLSAWHTYLMLGSWGEPVPLALMGAVAFDVGAVASVVALYRVGVRRDVQVTVQDVTAAPLSHDPDVPTQPDPDASTPVPATSNGRAREPGRVQVAVLDGRGGASWVDADEGPDPDASIWTAFDAAAASEQPWTWKQLGEALGVSAETARGRARRRSH